MGAVEDISVLFLLLLSCTEIHCDDVLISSPVGEIRGISSTISFNGQPYNISSFLGIPFAEPAVGPRRFAKPVKKGRFVTTFNATEAKLACPQNINWASGLDEIPVSEDCLNLNIFVPSGASQQHPKAVMIFIYGGGFQFGFQNSYISAALPVLHDIVYVTINYRVNVFGFLANKKYGLKGNYGLWDQHMAIQWVHDNIAAFGGDPGKVTLFGESAGAVAVMYQALYKGNKGLVHRIIAQSGSVGADYAYSKYPDLSFEDLTKRSGCKKGTFEETTACLRAMDFRDFKDLLRFEDNFSPVKDGEFIDYEPESIFKNESLASAVAVGNFGDVDVIIGLNSDEGLLELSLLAKVLGENITHFSDGVSAERLKTYMKRFLTNINKTSDSFVMKSLMHQYTDWAVPQSGHSRGTMLLNILRDFYYTIPAIQALNAHLNDKARGHTYMYYFDHKPSFSLSPDWVKGADHMEEIPFVFGFPGLYMFTYGIYSEDPAKLMPAEEMNLSMAMMKYWTLFAKTGNPNDAKDITLTQWPQYDVTNKTYLKFRADGNKVSSGSHFRDEFNYWTEIFPDMLQVAEAAKKTGEADTCLTGSGAFASLSAAWTTLYFSILMISATCII
ncbi:cholinesterase-like [Mercenaria mercenaria]|uniref:cholinesterase-like n=1 Tax=Mercenaria mercenaria TaxID=6596 RepID=UPI00234F09A8|nr:cholinesterase-like [Mercenaria mercenaria]XP_045207102.2 cholinesterase-like [Mercenaria mercenaria]